jgi:hypothetical protein
VVDDEPRVRVAGGQLRFTAIECFAAAASTRLTPGSASMRPPRCAALIGGQTTLKRHQQSAGGILHAAGQVA